jgi:dTDP-4-dehydrorhamnose 3,5-epimerase-like enzyme
MKVTTTPFEGLLEIYPVIFKDDRGYFLSLLEKRPFFLRE